MKKTYVTPELEIKKFAVEDIMSTSAVGNEDVYTDSDVTGASKGVVTGINYNDLFNL